MSEIEPCHSCENRNPGSWLYFWIPASAGMTLFNASNIKSLNLGKNKKEKGKKGPFFYTSISPLSLSPRGRGEYS